MKNTKSAAIYGAGGAAVGFGIAKLCKGSKKVTIGVTIGLALLCAFIGNNQ